MSRIDLLHACVSTNRVVDCADKSSILSDSYVLSPKSIALLVIGIVLGPVAFLWMARQEKMGKVALIPSSVWPNRYFSVICVLMFLVSAELNSLEYFFSLL